MQIEFDVEKRKSTLEARGLDMADAGEVFKGPHLTVVDDRLDYGEIRFITIGFLSDANTTSRMVVVVWTSRGDAYRIISMRKANDREQKIYEPRLRR